MLQENSDCDIDDQSSDFSVDMNFDKEHLLPESSVSLASLFDSLLFDFEDNPLGRLRVNLKEKVYFFFFFLGLFWRKWQWVTFLPKEENLDEGQILVRGTKSKVLVSNSLI